jgi:hypothetical protein
MMNAQRFRESSNSSQSLVNPSTTILNAYGIFTGLSTYPTYLKVTNYYLNKVSVLIDEVDILELYQSAPVMLGRFVGGGRGAKTSWKWPIPPYPLSLRHEVLLA